MSADFGVLLCRASAVPLFFRGSNVRISPCNSCSGEGVACLSIAFNLFEGVLIPI